MPILSYLALYSGVIPGKELLGTVLAMVMAALSVPAVALWWWLRPPRRPALPAAVYLVVALACTWGWPTGTDDELLFNLGFGVVMPWSLFYFLAALFLEADIRWGHTLAAVMLNTALVYGAAALFARRGRERRMGRAAD